MEGRSERSGVGANPPAAAQRREPAVLRVTGAVVAVVSGPLWAYAIARGVVETDREVIDHLDEGGRAVYGVYWLMLTSLLLFGSTVGYFALRAQRWTVLAALRLQQLALVAIAGAALCVAALR